MVKFLSSVSCGSLNVLPIQSLLTGKDLFSLQGTPVVIAGFLFSLQGFPCKPLYFPVRDCSVTTQNCLVNDCYLILKTFQALPACLVL